MLALVRREHFFWQVGNYSRKLLLYCFCYFIIQQGLHYEINGKGVFIGNLTYQP